MCYTIHDVTYMLSIPNSFIYLAFKGSNFLIVLSPQLINLVKAKLVEPSFPFFGLVNFYFALLIVRIYIIIFIITVFMGSIS